MSQVEKDISLTRIVKPRFLSLVGTPANQIAFKVVRGDTGEEKTVPHITRKRPTRRADAVVMFTFDLEYSDDEIRSALAAWGITDAVITEEDGKKRVKCSDAADAPTLTVTLGKGQSVSILKPISKQRSDKSAIAVAHIEFAKDYFPDEADIVEWCRRHEVDISAAAVENGDHQTVVRRSVQIGEGEETRKIEVDAGVQFAVVRAEEADVPQAFYTVVNDAAYGSWGWGQLDFLATMYDVEFCNLAGQAIRTLQDVAERIIYYSDLPLSVRKELITSAAGQFADFLVTLMDALPARVVVANRSIPEKEISMSKAKGQDGQNAERQDKTDATAAATTEAQASGEETTTTPAAETITRADVEKMIGDAMAGISGQIAELSAKLTAPAEGTTAQRSDGTANGDGGKPAAENASGELLQVVQRSFTELSDSIKSVAESVKGVSERVQSLEGNTVVRNDGGDQKQTTRKDVFVGIFGGGKRA
jgi:hypothetical protein